MGIRCNGCGLMRDVCECPEKDFAKCEDCGLICESMEQVMSHVLAREHEKWEVNTTSERTIFVYTLSLKPIEKGMAK